MTKIKKIILYILYFLMIFLAILFFVICKIQYNRILFSCFVTLLTFFTHFTIRFSIANFVCRFFIKDCDYKSSYFNVSKIEQKFYKLIFVKKWKSKLPTWNIENFDLRKVEPKIVLENMCKAEVYHQLCAFLSFFPILFFIPFGKFWIFFLTSIAGSFFDELFVIIQRYNRPRVEKLLKV